MPEVIYCPGKTPQQVVGIVRSLHGAGQAVLATRATPEQYAAVSNEFPSAVYNQAARAITMEGRRKADRAGLVVVVSAGTTDIPVAEEAALAAEHAGARVVRIFDVGVAGLHRMEGALPSVVAGMVECPVVAVPTSIGYGASFGGLAALLAMLNSCAAGVTVVNIDNGFGGGVAAAAINRVGGRK
jgi:NCAIR mutase (PurE)-related protein